MSSSARDEPIEEPKVDELEEAAVEAETAPAAEPAKRRRGRPPGSKNKKTLAAQAATAGTSSGAGTSGDPPVKRGRGRPPKRKPEEATDAEPQPKRKRGRPPKVRDVPPPVAEASADDGAEAEASDAAPKKKRGRPRKDAS